MALKVLVISQHKSAVIWRGVYNLGFLFPRIYNALLKGFKVKSILSKIKNEDEAYQKHFGFGANFVLNKMQREDL